MTIQGNWSKGDKLNRVCFYENLLSDKRVLDIGCVVGASKPDWVHGRIRALASEAVGIDVDLERIAQIQRDHGISIIHANAQDFDLGRKFDVVHAAELIEHLDNAAGFLTSVGKHLEKDGIFILTTPNAYRVVNFIYNVFGTLRVNDEHTCWYCEATLKTLLKRFNYDVVEIRYIPHRSYTPIRRFFSWIVRLCLSEKIAWNTLYVVARYRPNGSS